MVTQRATGSDRIATILNKAETGGGAQQVPRFPGLTAGEALWLPWTSAVGSDRSLDPQRFAQPRRFGMT